MICYHDVILIQIHGTKSERSLSNSLTKVVENLTTCSLPPGAQLATNMNFQASKKKKISKTVASGRHSAGLVNKIRWCKLSLARKATWSMQLFNEEK